MSSVTPSKWLAALGIVAALLLVLFVMGGFWYAVYTPGVASTCSGPFTMMEILA
ncbi:hypothetical protein [Vulcanisaeta distributa]|uniref:hypothetical protein n=1 Tax=Vulcanisaeta distributa TaxID=164451 RepID=UPI001FB2C491|nr:hypothetical protein [Vulcanisaeta distributa]